MRKNRFGIVQIAGLCRVLALLSALMGQASTEAREVNFNGDLVGAYDGSGDEKSRYFNYDERFQLRDFFSEKQTSVPQFLKTLPVSLRQGYTLIHNSGSIQAASYSNPRVIMFSPTADLVLSFNGHEEMVGGEAVEVMAYNDITDRYDFHELIFTARGAKDVVNPHKCKACHTEGYIPNWHAYNTWVGAFGANADDFLDKTIPVRRVFEPGVDFEKDPIQLSAFQNFVANRKTNGDRYIYLENPPSEERWPYYTPEKTPVGIALDDIQPNRRLTIALLFRTSRMLGARLEKTQLFKKYPANVVAQLLECDTRSIEFTKRLRDVREASVLKFGDIDYRTNPKIQITIRDPNEKQHDFLNALSVSGILPEYWALNPLSRSPNLDVNIHQIGSNIAFTSYAGNLEANESPLLAGSYLFRQLAKQHRELFVPETKRTQLFANYVGLSVDSLTAFGRIIPLYDAKKVSGEICPKLESLVRKEIDQNAKIVVEINKDQERKYTNWKNGIPYVLERCITCHAQGNYSTAPYIPFDKPQLLRRQLHANSDQLLNDITRRVDWEAPDEIRMPQGPFPILPGQSRQLIKYLESL